MSERIPIADLGREYLELKPEMDAAVERVLASGQYVGGPEVEGLEREFAAFCGAPFAVVVGNGTDALRFALMAAGLAPPGALDGSAPAGAPGEVITSPMTFIATTEAITQAGGRPVFVDVDPASYTLDPRLVEKAITKRTRAIVPVHLYGQTADMGPILALAESRGLRVVEDACQAHGASYNGRPAGTMGDAAAFSFYPTKNLGACGEGGAVTTSRAEIATRVRRIRDHGQAEKYRHVEEGYNGRLDALQAALLRVKLVRLAAWNERRRALAARYSAGLREVSVPAPAGPLSGPGVVLPAEMSWGGHVYHLYTVRVADRDRVRAALRERGIDTGVHYPVPLHLQPAYAWMGLKEGSFPRAEAASREVLTLPIYPGLSDAQADRVCRTLREVVGAR